MKKLSITCFFILTAFLFSCKEKANGQEKEDNGETPQAVMASFQKKYPGENDPDWRKDDHGNYESHFKIDGIKYRADFNADGSWIETETSIDKDDLPEAIKEKIKELYDDMKIAEVEKVDHHSKGVFYDVEFKQEGKNKDVEFKANGEIIN